MKGAPSVLVVAGEPSGDAAAAEVVSGLKSAAPSLRCFGMGGPAMEAVGVSLVADIRTLSAMGVKDTLAGLGRLAGAWTAIRLSAERERPDVALLVDAPDLTLPLARILTEQGTAVVQYVGPQVWAWRADRLALLKRRVKKVALILPFEKPLYAAAGVPAEYVGHPIVDRPKPSEERRRSLKETIGLGDGQKLVALLPGSRPGELKRHTPPMCEAADRLAQAGIRAVLAPFLMSRQEGGHMGPPLQTARELLSIADAALVASGTATLEAATFGVPMAAVYKTDAVTHFAAKHLLKLPYVALPNWIVGGGAVPEILQKEVTGTGLFQVAEQLLTEAEQGRQHRVLERVSTALGPGGAAERVAEMVRELLP